MIYIAPLTTSRLTLAMRECPIGEAISVAMMPSALSEACTTRFLRATITEGGPHPEPALWTVQERMLACGHYLAGIHTDAPNFKVGDGNFSDYLDSNTDIPGADIDAAVQVGDLLGDVWSVRHLRGYMAESIERLQGLVDVPGGSPFLHWQFGCMAAQMCADGQPEEPAWNIPGQYDDWLALRMRILIAFAESDLSELLRMYLDGKQQLYHLFDLALASDGGIVALPVEVKGVEAVLLPATFHPHSCVSRLAHRMAGNSQEPGL